MPQDATQPLADRWYVTNGVVAIGPVSYDMLLRNLAHGRIPPGSLARHESWHVWQSLRDIDALSVDDRLRLQRALARASEHARDSVAPPSRSSTREAKRAVNPLSLRPAPVDPVGIFTAASDLESAMLLCVSTTAAAIAASAVLLHRPGPDGDFVTSYAFGSGSETTLGQRLPASDASVAAGLAGITVQADPVAPAGAGAAIRTRLAPLLGEPLGAAMVPLRLRDETLALVELGRRRRAFSARDLARVEEILEVLAEQLLVAGWLD